MNSGFNGLTHQSASTLSPSQTFHSKDNVFWAGPVKTLCEFLQIFHAKDIWAGPVKTLCEISQMIIHNENSYL